MTLAAHPWEHAEPHQLMPPAVEFEERQAGFHLARHRDGDAYHKPACPEFRRAGWCPHLQAAHDRASQPEQEFLADARALLDEWEQEGVPALGVAQAAILDRLWAVEAARRLRSRALTRAAFDETATPEERRALADLSVAQLGGDHATVGRIRRAFLRVADVLDGRPGMTTAETYTDRRTGEVLTHAQVVELAGAYADAADAHEEALTESRRAGKHKDELEQALRALLPAEASIDLGDVVVVMEPAPRPAQRVDRAAAEKHREQLLTLGLGRESLDYHAPTAKELRDRRAEVIAAGVPLAELLPEPVPGPPRPVIVRKAA